MSDEMEDELLEFFKEEEGNEQQQKRKREEKEKRAVPLKKRLVNPTKVEEIPKEDSVGSDESSGNELYWDKEDKKLLLSLPEAKRERILYERAEKLKDQLETKHLSEEVKSKHKSSQKPPSPAGTAGGKNRSHVNIKRASLDEIKALHNSKTSRSTKSTKRQMKEKEEDDYYEEESGDYTDEPLEAGEEDRTNNEGEEEEATRTSENKQPVSPILPPIETLNELLPAVVKRSTLEKWYSEPYWERAILRLFVRVMIGQGQDRTYRIAEIMQLIDANYVYKFGKKECNQLVTLKIGDKTKNFELKYLSNESPTDDEFNSWKQWNISLNETLPSKLQIEHLEEQIKCADNYSYTDEDIERIVKKNKENNLVPINYTKEKIRLLDLIQQEKVNGHYDKISTYYQQLTELEHKEEEEINQKKKYTGSTSMNNINKRNAQDDIQNAQKLRQIKQIIKANTNDPYARRSTNAAVSWIKGKKKSDDKSEGHELLGEKSGDKDQKNPSGSQKTKIKVDIDINNISQKKPDILSNKPILKPITTTSITVSNDQVKTLSLSDYKKAAKKE